MNLIKSYRLSYKDKKKNKKEEPKILIYFLDEDRIRSKEIDCEDEYVSYVVDILRNERPVYWDMKKEWIISAEEVAGKRDTDKKGANLEYFQLVTRYRLIYDSKKEKHQIIIYYDKEGVKKSLILPVEKQYLHYVVDFLRNEKPIYWNKRKSVLRTTLEPSGVLESDSKKGRKDKYELVENYSLKFNTKEEKPVITVYWQDTKSNAYLGEFLSGAGLDTSFIVDILRYEKPIFWHSHKQELRTGQEPIGTEESDIQSSSFSNYVVIDNYALVYYAKTEKQKITIYWKDPQNPEISRFRDIYVEKELIPYLITMLRYEKPIFWNDEMGDLCTGMEPVGTEEIDNQAMGKKGKRENLLDNYMLMYNINTKEIKVRLNWKDSKNLMINYSQDISLGGKYINFVIDMLRHEKPVFWNQKDKKLTTLEEPTSVGDLTPQELLLGKVQLKGIPASKFNKTIEIIADPDDKLYPVLKYKAVYDYKKGYHTLYIYYQKGKTLYGTEFPVDKDYISYMLNMLQNESNIMLNETKGKLYVDDGLIDG